MLASGSHTPIVTTECRPLNSRIDDLRAPGRRWPPPGWDNRRWLRRAHAEATSILPGAVAVIGSALLAVIVADALTDSRSRAVVIVYFALALAAIARRGLLGLTQLFAATLPWLVVAGDRLPRLTETFAAGALTALVILVAVPQSDGSNRSFLLRVGIVCFYGPVLLSLAQEGYGDQFIQAAKYAVFPAIVFAVTEATNHRGIMSLAMVSLVSGTVALSANLALGVAGFGGFGSYAASRIVEYGGEHDLALLAACLTAASLAASRSLKWSPAVVVGAISTVATGVRSALPGLAVVAIARLVASGARIRTMVLVTLGVVAVFASGAAAVVEARLHAGQERGEFESFSAFGSGRGEIYATAIESWRAASPIDWFIGTGLRSIPRLEEEKLGSALVGHSDLIEVGVQLGIIGLIGLALIWWVLIARARSKAPLVVLASFALFNGALEYSAALVTAVLLTAGARDAYKRMSTRITGPATIPARPGLRSELAARKQA
jgi:hypothetical protein